MKETEAVVLLAALAQGARLRVFRALVGAAPAGMTPGALAAMLDLPPSTLSFHLKELAHAGLVTQERDGRHLIYRPTLARMNALIQGLEGVPQVLPASLAAISSGFGYRHDPFTGGAAMHAGLDDHPKVTLHDYEGLDHGFAAEMGDRRDEAGAQLADSRTRAFLAANLA